MNISTDEFNENDLVEVYGPASLGKVWPGNKVMLRSGGPKMTVVKQWNDCEALCMWGDDGEYKELFFLACLTCYGAK